jgi:hypothetical protein
MVVLSQQSPLRLQHSGVVTLYPMTAAAPLVLLQCGLCFWLPVCALSGRVHKGAASATIGSKPVGGVLLGRVRPLSGNFKLPDDPAVPVIMVGPGEGMH